MIFTIPAFWLIGLPESQSCWVSTTKNSFESHQTFFWAVAREGLGIISWMVPFEPPNNMGGFKVHYSKIAHRGVSPSTSVICIERWLWRFTQWQSDWVKEVSQFTWLKLYHTKRETTVDSGYNKPGCPLKIVCYSRISLYQNDHFQSDRQHQMDLIDTIHY